MSEFCQIATIEFKRRADKLENSPRHVGTLLESLNKFSKKFGTRQISLLEGDEIKSWLSTLVGKDNETLAIGTRTTSFARLPDIAAKKWLRWNGMK